MAHDSHARPNQCACGCCSLGTSACTAWPHSHHSWLAAQVRTGCTPPHASVLAHSQCRQGLLGACCLVALRGPSCVLQCAWLGI